MTIGTIKTQGTELWVIDTISATDPAVLKFSCPTGITGLGASNGSGYVERFNADSVGASASYDWIGADTVAENITV
jgi:hypothetical protein